MSEEGWSGFHRRWSALKPPLRANHEVVAALAAIIAEHRGMALLLGVTPELCDIAAATVALDKSETMVAHVWPGDTAALRAVLGDWLANPLPRQFTAAIGDGSLNALASGEYRQLFAELERVLLPGARLAVRVYARPEACESLAQLREDTLAGRAGGFHAFKWRLAMAIAAESGADVPVATIHRVFQREYPNRAALAKASGWSPEQIAEIDAYEGLATVYSFPTRAELARALPPGFVDPRFLPSGSYALAERCPILVADLPP